MAFVRRHATVLVLLVALTLRLAVLAATPDFVPAGDPADYSTHATAIAGALTYPRTQIAEPFSPSALRPPAYPALLGGAYALPGDDKTAGRLLGVALGTLTVYLVLLLGTRLFGARTGRWAGAIAAVLGPLVWLNAALLSESFFTPLVLGALLCLLSRTRTRTRTAATAAGALLALAALTRSNGAILVLPLAGALLASRDRRALAAALAAFIVVLVPWTVRNAVTFDGRLLPLGTQSGYTMAGQWNDVAAAPGELQAAWRLGQEVPALAPLFGRRGIDEAELDAELRRRALRFARDRPRHVLTALGLNTLRLLDLGPGRAFTTDVALTEMNVPARHRGGLRLTAYLVMALALAGIAVLVRRRQAAGPWWVWAVPVLLFFSVAPLLGSPRYRAPVDAFLAILAAVAVAAWRGRREDTVSTDRTAD